MVDLITRSRHQLSYAKLYIGFAALRPSGVSLILRAVLLCRVFPAMAVWC